MDISLLLADSAQVSEGKVHALGIGWTQAPVPTPPFAVVLLVDVDWSGIASQFDLTLELVDEDGRVVQLPTPLGPQPLSTQLHAECHHDPATPGAPSRIPFVVNFGPGLPLAPGHRYQWRATAPDAVAWCSFVVALPAQ